MKALPPWRSTIRRKSATSLDGTRVSYEVVGEGERVLLLANGLGGRLYAWAPLLDKYWEHYRLVTWDYRGLFDSDAPNSQRRMAINHHVDDAVAILEAEGVTRAVAVGWSMGVQVSLDVAATHPELIAGLVLLNGTYGHTLSTGFQPLFTVPGMPKALHKLIEWVRSEPIKLETLATLARLGEPATVLLFSALAGPKRSLELRTALQQYTEDVLGESFDHYMHLFQELDAHSVYHMLPQIEAPALIVSGALDLLTPARQSREMARRMPHAEHIALKRSSHFSLLEHPRTVVPAVDRFLTQEALW